MQRTRLFSLMVLVGLLAAGCSPRQPEINFNNLPPSAFTIPENTLPDVRNADGSIPERYWGGPLRALKPLRVYDDRLNIVVVTEQRGNEERGVYFYRSISSYYPTDEPGRKFSWNAKTKQLEYVFTK